MRARGLTSVCNLARRPSIRSQKGFFRPRAKRRPADDPLLRWWEGVLCGRYEIDLHRQSCAGADAVNRAHGALCYAGRQLEPDYDRCCDLAM